MIQRVTLPRLGESVETATLDRWLKQEGDAVAPGEILCEITTDKATLEVESTSRGTLLRIVARRGQELPVGALIAVVGDPGETIPAEIPAEACCGVTGIPGTQETTVIPSAARNLAAETGRAPSHPAGCAPGGRVAVSPRASRRAAELGVAVDRITGTGPGGRIVEADVEAAVRVVASEGNARAAGEAAPEASESAGDIVPLTPMRRVIAQRMLESKQSIPCYYLEMDADMTDLVALRNKLNAKAAGSVKLTFNVFVLKACGAALGAFPVVNSRWVEGRGIERRREVNVGFAVGLEDGLIAPVVRDADRKSLAQISAESADLAERARTKRLRPEEFQGGSMTVSNLGMFGVRSFIPIPSPGESTILGLGTIADRVVFRQDSIQVRKMMAMTLAVDHRLVDGAQGAQFLEAIKNALESPQTLAK
jgi:pyruvate dehydrogenase E2 component (dihydrolipoamide acetyltransferase)